MKSAILLKTGPIRHVPKEPHPIHLAAHRWQAAISELAAAAGAMAHVSHIDAAYFQLLLAYAHLGANELGEANRISIEATRIFSSAGVETIALAAKRVGLEATFGQVRASSIIALIRAVEAAP